MFRIHPPATKGLVIGWVTFRPRFRLLGVGHWELGITKKEIHCIKISQKGILILVLFSSTVLAGRGTTLCQTVRFNERSHCVERLGFNE